MAKLTALPHQGIIDGLKGQVDFYYWMGIPIARSWPRSPGRQRSPTVMAQWPSFTHASREWNELDETMREAYRELAEAAGLSGRDLQMRGYLHGLYRYELG